jgi:two-component system LytT family sensor kinase
MLEKDESAKGALGRRSGLKSQLRAGITLLLISTAATVLFTCVSCAINIFAGESPQLKFLLIWHASKFYLWAAIAPFIVVLARRHPIQRRNWIRSLIFHSVIALLCSLVVTSLELVISWRAARYSTLLEGIADGSIPFTWGAIVYGSILLAINARDNYARYRHEQLRASQLQNEVLRAQLQTLRMQLQPHFLFNTLHSISDLVLEDAEAAVSMITKLGDFLRLTIEGASEQLIPLRKELDFIRAYLAIEQVRFHDRLKVTIAAEPQSCSAQVPNLILQPLVENAIRHGISACVGTGHISIATERRADRLHITVRDDGAGPQVPREGSHEGVGLANTRARLRTLYGDKQFLELTSRNSDITGTVVSLSIPFVTVGSESFRLREA